MNPSRMSVLLVLCATALALALRLPSLELRPMHTDEAVHAVKFGDLLEKGEYRYDPYEFHGPTLNYLSLPIAWVRGQKTITQVDETTLRLLPVLFGVGLVLLWLLIAGGIGRCATVVAALLTALSPAFVFYSRYYIMEILLVFFTGLLIGSLYRYSQKRKWYWLTVAGTALGLMIATKETWIIAVAALAGASAIVGLWRGFTQGPHVRPPSQKRAPSLLQPAQLPLALGVSLFVAFLFLSSFCQHPEGFIDAFRTYAIYFDRAEGSDYHLHAWSFYFKRLFYYHPAPGPVWSEALIAALALVGLIVSLAGRRRNAAHPWFLRLLAVYTLLITLVYTALPYKTPWCLLGFWHGMIGLAGIGGAALFQILRPWPIKIVLAAALLLGGVHLAKQAHSANVRFHDDQRNPYVYAHTTRSAVRLAQRVEELSHFHPAGHNLRINLIAHPDNYWPLPWYLRNFSHGSNTVGFFTEIPAEPDVPVVITSRALAPAVRDKLSQEYVSDVYGLRPDVLLFLYVQQDLWNAFMESRH